MSRDTGKKKKHVAIVFGGRSPIAISCAISLANAQQVFLVTRKIDDALQNEVAHLPAITLVEADLDKVGAASSVILSIYEQGFEPTALAFLQRYRPSGEPSFDEHSRVELWSIREALEGISQLKSTSASVNVVVSSSPAANHVLDDQDASYHVVKAGQEALVRFYSVKLRGNGISVNAVRIGSLVIKPRAKKYWDSVPRVVEGLASLSPTGRILTSTEVGERLAGLISPIMNGLSGQLFTIDAGYSLLDGAQLAKAALEMNQNDDD